MQNFSDILKKSFVQGFSNGNISTSTILITLLITSVLALYIYFVYYFVSKKTFYSKSFNVSLALISIITASILLAMQSNLVISLGMVGALSIVRFRTAIKDPMDLMFLFWSIAVGVICGANLFEVALLTCVILTVFMFVLDKINLGRPATLLIINGSDQLVMQELSDCVGSACKHYKVKSRSISGGKLDMIIELKLTADAQEILLEKLTKLKGITSTTLMEHDSEVTI